VAILRSRKEGQNLDLGLAFLKDSRNGRLKEVGEYKRRSFESRAQGIGSKLKETSSIPSARWTRSSAYRKQPFFEVWKIDSLN
jgi:hypothetical protein